MITFEELKALLHGGLSPKLHKFDLDHKHEKKVSSVTNMLDQVKDNLPSSLAYLWYIRHPACRQLSSITLSAPLVSSSS